MAFSGSVLVDFTTQLPGTLIGDEITIEFYSLENPANSYTMSLSEGQGLAIELIPIIDGDYPYAIANSTYGCFVSGTSGTDTLIFNTSLSSFYGSYLQVPYFISGSGNNATVISSSLFDRYAEILYAFKCELGDRIVLKSKDGRTQEVMVRSVNSSNSDRKVRVRVIPDLDPRFIDNTCNIVEFLLVKRIKDEQNIILKFKKIPGQTSYGFVIPENIDIDLLRNISAVQTNVQDQLLSTQQNTQ